MTGATLGQTLREAQQSLQQGRLDEADDLYRTILAEHPHSGDANIGRAIIAKERGQLAEAIDFAAHAARQDTTNANVLEFLAGLQIEAGLSDAAIETYRSSLERFGTGLRPLLAIGALHTHRLEYEQAADAFEQVLDIDPDNAAALTGLGYASQHRGLDSDVDYFRRALEAGHATSEIHAGLGIALLRRQAFDEALDHFRAAERFALDRLRLPGPDSPIPLSFLVHGREQLEYLNDNGIRETAGDDCYTTLRQLTDAHAAERGGERNTFVNVSADDIGRIAPLFKSIVYRGDGSRVDGSAINPELDSRAVEQDYAAREPGITSIDDMLTPAALDRLYRYCVESTIFKRAYGAGYVGSVLAEGFASPILLQIAEDLRSRFPAIFGDHRLNQAWAYKYDSSLSGIRIHADSAQVNVNFWISPDAGNLDPDSGGLIVWDKIAPQDWDFEDYNKNQQKIENFLAESGANDFRVPFRQNRALIFNSALFHKTDEIHFADRYPDRRINVTMLFGRGLR